MLLIITPNALRVFNDVLRRVFSKLLEPFIGVHTFIMVRQSEPLFLRAMSFNAGAAPCFWIIIAWEL